MYIGIFSHHVYMVLLSLVFRQFEERELLVQQDRAKKRLEFENQKFRLQNQIEFERSRDTIGRYQSYLAFFLGSVVFTLSKVM